MNYRKLGRYGIRVSEVSVGGWLTHGRSIDDSTTQEIVKTAFDLGVNFFDTADVYHRGQAELSLAKAIKGIRREDLVIATKCFFPMSEAPNDRGLSRKHIFESVHSSLKRLELDYIDLMQFHRFDAETPIDETVSAISDLVRQGKVLYWGVSEWNAQQIASAVHISKEIGGIAPSSNQPRYSMLTPEIEQHVIPVSEQYGLGQVVFSPLAQGVLTGKYLPNSAPPQGTRAADDTSNQFMKPYLEDAVLSRVQKLKKYAESLGTDLAEFALAWCLRKSNISSVIIGASNPGQVQQNVKASGLLFGDDVWEKSRAILDGSLDSA